MSGNGIAADELGNLFFTTGNSHFSAAAGHWPPNNLQESIVKDFFTPSDVVDLDVGDLDTGSGGIMLLPIGPHSIRNSLTTIGSLRRLQTRRKQPGASKGVITSA